MYKKRIWESAWTGLCCMLLAVSCAGKETRTVVPPSKEPATIRMEASSFDFKPNYIQAHQGDRIVFEIKNVSDSEHDFTIKNPRGEILKSVDLPPHATVNVPIAVDEAGTYPFYCDKPFHSSLGMKGKVEVLQSR